jgi:hypothetical protein
MQKAPEARYAGTPEVIAALEPLAGDAPVPAPRPAAERRPAAPTLSAAPRSDRRGAAMTDTVRAAERPTPTSPTRPVPAPEPRKAAAKSAPRPAPQRSWEERLGPIGIAIVAVIACAAAWLVTWKLF